MTYARKRAQDALDRFDAWQAGRTPHGPDLHDLYYALQGLLSSDTVLERIASSLSGIEKALNATNEYGEVGFQAIARRITEALRKS